jgi:hypothetical protein
MAHRASADNSPEFIDLALCEGGRRATPLAERLEHSNFQATSDFGGVDLQTLSRNALSAPRQALGHNSKAVHRAYAKRALMNIPSLEDYERKVAGAAMEKAS